jgi:HD-GYP domain-containing protein (c-di-GMP phosphodiesterase class II)
MDRNSFRFLETVIDTCESKTLWTANHSKRVERFAAMIGTFLGLDAETKKTLTLAARFHDIGKIGINDHLLEKQERLTGEEFEIIKKHTSLGADLFNAYLLDLLDLGTDLQSSSKKIGEILSVIRHHHERVDGQGYPDGLRGNEISFLAKIVYVADSLDSMLANRPYRPAPGIDFALQELKDHRGTQFDPDIVDAFLAHFDQDMLLVLNEALHDLFPPF